MKCYKVKTENIYEKLLAIYIMMEEGIDWCNGDKPKVEDAKGNDSYGWGLKVKNNAISAYWIINKGSYEASIDEEQAIHDMRLIINNWSERK